MLGVNGKVSNLAQMLPQARYEHIIINDSDILVPRDYLVRVLAPLAQPGVGMVTTLYRGLAGRTLGSKLEALGLSTDFTGGVLVARAMEGGIRFGLGATIATTKTVLHEIGGLEPLADYLGDDYELGARTAAAGHQVQLADIVVETALPDYNFRDFWEHQLRWARNVRDRRPGAVLWLDRDLWPGLGCARRGWRRPRAWWTWLVLAVTVALRVAAAVVIGRGVLADPQVLRDLWLLPLRDLVALAVWMVSYFGDEVEWRGLRFRLRDGKTGADVAVSAFGRQMRGSLEESLDYPGVLLGLIGPSRFPETGSRCVRRLSAISASRSLWMAWRSSHGENGQQRPSGGLQTPF